MERLHVGKEKIGIIIGKKGAVKKLLEQELDVTIKISSSGAITIEGDTLNAYRATHVLQAIAFGFSPDSALELKNPEFSFETINVKNFAESKKRISEIKGRLIGKSGRVKRVIQDLGAVDLCITENRIGLIGESSDVGFARRAIQTLLRGAKHSRIFKTFEQKNRAFERR